MNSGQQLCNGHDEVMIYKVGTSLKLRTDVVLLVEMEK